MKLIKRAMRIFQATIHDVIDQVGDKQKLIAHHLNEMKEGIDQLNDHLNDLERKRQAAEAECVACSETIRCLEQEVFDAIRNDEEIKARTLITKMIRCQLDLESMNRACDDLVVVLKTQSCQLKRRQRCYEAMKQRAAKRNEKRSKTISFGDFPETTSTSVEGTEKHMVELELLRMKEIVPEEGT